MRGTCRVKYRIEDDIPIMPPSTRRPRCSMEREPPAEAMTSATLRGEDRAQHGPKELYAAERLSALGAPEAAVILGTGLGVMERAISVKEAVPYRGHPRLPRPVREGALGKAPAGHPGQGGCGCHERQVPLS